MMVTVSKNVLCVNSRMQCQVIGQARLSGHQTHCSGSQIEFDFYHFIAELMHRRAMQWQRDRGFWRLRRDIGNPAESFRSSIRGATR